MGWYLRKSFGFGPLRLNLSKSGIGYSVGVRGARIGAGPRGNYVRLGRGGVYYQKYFSPSTARPSTPSVRPASVPNASPELGTPVATADVSELHDSTSDRLLREIQRKYAEPRFAPIVAVGTAIVIVGLLAGNVPLWVVLFLIPVLATVYGSIARKDYDRKLVILNYELDADALASYVELLSAMQTFAGSGRISRITSRQFGVARKYHAGANTLIDKRVISLRVAVPFGFETRIAVWALPLGDQTLYFFPDRVLVYEGSRIGAVSYETISVALEHSRFVEEDGVPSDAKIVDRTWRYVNKNGTPDRRFGNNRQLPVVLYAQIAFSTRDGLNILLESSDPSKAATLKAGIDKYVASRNHTAS